MEKPRLFKPKKHFLDAQLFFSGAQAERGFSSDDVFSCKATSEDVRAGAGACSQAQSHDVSTKARSAKTSAEGFLRFLF